MNRDSVEKAREMASVGQQVGPAFVTWLCDEWLTAHKDDDSDE